MEGLSTFYFTLLRCAGGTVHLHLALRLWASAERQLYLVSDAYGDNPHGQYFSLEKGVQLVGCPWANPLEQGLGLGHAEALLLAD